MDGLVFGLSVFFGQEGVLQSSEMALSTEDHIKWTRIEKSWCWTCNQSTEHKVFFRYGYFAGRWTVCNICADTTVKRS